MSGVVWAVETLVMSTFAVILAPKDTGQSGSTVPFTPFKA